MDSAWIETVIGTHKAKIGDVFMVNQSALPEDGAPLVKGSFAVMLIGVDRLSAKFSIYGMSLISSCVKINTILDQRAVIATMYDSIGKKVSQTIITPDTIIEHLTHDLRVRGVNKTCICSNLRSMFEIHGFVYSVPIPDFGDYAIPLGHRISNLDRWPLSAFIHWMQATLRVSTEPVSVVNKSAIIEKMWTKYISRELAKPVSRHRRVSSIDDLFKHVPVNRLQHDPGFQEFSISVDGRAYCLPNCGIPIKPLRATRKRLPDEKKVPSQAHGVFAYRGLAYIPMVGPMPCLDFVWYKQEASNKYTVRIPGDCSDYLMHGTVLSFDGKPMYVVVDYSTVRSVSFRAYIFTFQMTERSGEATPFNVYVLPIEHVGQIKMPKSLGNQINSLVSLLNKVVKSKSLTSAAILNYLMISNSIDGASVDTERDHISFIQSRLGSDILFRVNPNSVPILAHEDAPNDQHQSISYVRAAEGSVDEDNMYRTEASSDFWTDDDEDTL